MYNRSLKKLNEEYKILMTGYVSNRDKQAVLEHAEMVLRENIKRDNVHLITSCPTKFYIIISICTTSSIVFLPF